MWNVVYTCPGLAARALRSGLTRALSTHDSRGNSWLAERRSRSWSPHTMLRPPHSLPNGGSPRPSNVMRRLAPHASRTTSSNTSQRREMHVERSPKEAHEALFARTCAPAAHNSNPLHLDNSAGPIKVVLTSGARCEHVLGRARGARVPRYAGCLLSEVSACDCPQKRARRDGTAAQAAYGTDEWCRKMRTLPSSQRV